MANVLPTAAPAYAVKVWADDLNIYAEVPSINQPCVVAFPYSESGLSRALAMLGAKHTVEGAGELYQRPPVLDKKMQKEGLDQRDLDAARACLKSLGILK
jgi:hypothetical protein